MVTICTRKETMAERKTKGKDIHPEYRPVVFMDTTTGNINSLAVQQKRPAKQMLEFEGEIHPLIRVEISSDLHTYSTLDVKSSPSNRWIA